jgi:hypothetical protein
MLSCGKMNLFSNTETENRWCTRHEFQSAICVQRLRERYCYYWSVKVRGWQWKWLLRMRGCGPGSQGVTPIRWRKSNIRYRPKSDRLVRRGSVVYFCEKRNAIMARLMVEWTNSRNRSLTWSDLVYGVYNDAAPPVIWNWNVVCTEEFWKAIVNFRIQSFPRELKTWNQQQISDLWH